MKTLLDANGIYFSHVIFIGKAANLVYRALNGEPRLWINDNKVLYDDRTLREIAEEFEKSPQGIMETRNPLLINYFSDEFAVEHCAVYCPESKSYIQAFTDKDIKKLGSLGPGEVLADKGMF